MKSIKSLHFYNCILVFIFLLSMISITITQPTSLYYSSASTADDLLSTNHTPFNFKFIQGLNTDNNKTETATNGNNDNIQNRISDPPSVRVDPRLTLLPFVISIAIVSGILIFVARLNRRPGMQFSDIIRDASGFPSLARFQFLSWTLIIMFAVLSIYFIRLFMGTPALPNDIPTNLLILTGISVAVPFVSNPISNIKYGERAPTQGTLKQYDRRHLATMLMENDKPTVSRFQMFAWTIISIIIYLSFFFSQTFSPAFCTGLSKGVPDIPQIFVYLMGLSQLAYVGNKATISQTLTVLQISRHEAAPNEDLIIFGTNFGNETQKGKVLFEDGDKDRIGKQVVVQPRNIIEWSDSRIHIKVPTEGLASDNPYYIRVANRGMISYKAGGQDDESKFELSKENRGGELLDLE